MNTTEILTLLLVVFAALTYIEQHNKKIASHHHSRDAITYFSLYTLQRASDFASEHLF